MVKRTVVTRLLLTTDISLPLTILFADRHHLALKKAIVVRIRLPKVVCKAQTQPELQFNNKQKGLLRLFAGCKKIKAKRNGNNFKEEYLLLKKRPSSSGREA